MTTPARHPAARALQILSALIGSLAGLMVLRALFRLLMANPDNPVTTAVYTASRPFLFPWSLWWPPSDLPVLVLEQAALAAAATYLVLALGFAALARARAGPQEKPHTEV